MKRAITKLATLACSILLIAACTEEEIFQQPGSQPADGSVAFAAELPTDASDAITKGAITEKEDFLEFGVHAFYKADGEPLQTDEDTPDFMYNQKVERATGTSTRWFYSPKKYWSIGGDTAAIHTFAYAPRNNEYITLSGRTHQGYPTLTYTAPELITAQPDILVATKTMKRKSSGNAITFTHALARVSFQFNDNDAGWRIESITLKDILSKGKYTYNATGGTWSDQSEPEDLTASIANGSLIRNVAPSTSSKANITSTNGYLFLLPQDNVKNKTVTVSYKHITNGSTKTVDFALPDDTPTTWNAGEAYTYSFLSAGYNGTVADFVERYNSTDPTKLKELLGGTCITFTDADEAGWKSSELKTILKKLDGSSISINMSDFSGDIPTEAFFDCSALTEVSFPEMTNGNIGDYAFQNCTSLREVNFPKMEGNIGDEAFYSCSALTEVSFPEMKGYIGNSAFHFCTDLTEVSFPEMKGYIGNSAFYYSALTKASFPKMEGDIGNDVFISCTSLTEVSFPEMIGNIGEWVFNKCENLTKASFPKMTGNIGECVFKDCAKLTALTLGPISDIANIDPIAWNGFTTGSCILTISRSATPSAEPTEGKDQYWGGTTWGRIITTTP